ncbi:MAG: hypothetical protein OXC13_05060 [Caldilineaceae bacterium]|nr:hypothetical protein [Caldilineaceae bacterium]
MTYEGRQWRITPIGQEEANRVKEDLEDTMARFQRSLTTLMPRVPTPFMSVGPQQALKSLVSIGRNDHISAFVELQQSSVEGLRKAMEPLVLAPTQNAFAEFRQSLVEDFRKATEPLALAQIQNATRIKTTLTAQIGLDMVPALQALNRSLASAIDDGIALSNLASTPLTDRSWSHLNQFPPVSAQLPAITEAVEALNRQMPSVIGGLRMSAPSDILIPVVTPTTATAAYTRSLRLWLEEDSQAGPPEGYILPDSHNQILTFLAEVDPGLAEKHRGAWSTLRRGGPDSLRHSAVSMRELLRVLFERLVPDEQLPQTGKVNLKARVRQFFGGNTSSAQFAMNLSMAIDGMYCRLNAYTHGDETNRSALQALHTSADGILLFVRAYALRSP